MVAILTTLALPCLLAVTVGGAVLVRWLTPRRIVQLERAGRGLWAQWHTSPQVAAPPPAVPVTGEVLDRIEDDPA